MGFLSKPILTILGTQEDGLDFLATPNALLMLRISQDLCVDTSN